MSDINCIPDDTNECASSQRSPAETQNDVESSSDFELKSEAGRKHDDLGDRQEEIHQIVKESTMKCIPCSFAKEDNDATAFCLSCPDKEPMCSECAEQHIREKETRGHRLCQDLKKLTLTPSVPDNPLQWCSLCSLGDDIKAATHFCLNCKKPEPMCSKCAKQHTKQRLARGHTLCDNISQFPNTLNLEERNLTNTPGIPTSLEIFTDAIEIVWEKSAEKVDYYRIRYKSNECKEKWNYADTNTDLNKLTITRLKPNTRYTFQVRAIFEDQEGNYGPANDDLKTLESSASSLLNDMYSNKVEDKNPGIYRLKAQEQTESRNHKAKTKKIFFGNPVIDLQEEKTILLIGATGSGKTTLVDGIVNFVMGVNFSDPFRFTIVQLEEEERKTRKAMSQTEWISVYRIAPQKGGRLRYALNIIDTPGFGDTRGIERDEMVTDQIRQLFSSEDEKGVSFLDAVCFIVKAPDARLTISQRYIFNSIMSLFGKDVKSNICILVTFADGGKPPVLETLNEAKLPLDFVFEFNNSALFAPNTNLSSTSMSPASWELGLNSFQQFF